MAVAAPVTAIGTSQAAHRVGQDPGIRCQALADRER